MPKDQNQQVLLVRRPVGEPVQEDFSIVDAEMPSSPCEGQTLLRNLYLSIDPYLRGRMQEHSDSYAKPFALGEPIEGATLAKVLDSRHEGFAPGDLVISNSGWRTFALSDGQDLRRVPSEVEHVTHALGVLGMTGFTAWYGLLQIGKAVAGETVVVAAASGAVGSVVGQIARLKGCRVVGIAGGGEKCRHVVEELRFDACVDHRDPGFAVHLAEAVPAGVDIYFENVGGAVFDAVWPHMNLHSRVPVCGLIAGYNATATTAGPDRLAPVAMTLITKRILMQGFLNGDHVEDHFATFQREVGAWVASGDIHVREDIVIGLEKAPEALRRVLSGRNLGKTLVKLNDSSVAAGSRS